ncbi:ras-like protein [Anaeramoeba ignava]|uniref:Ras-like protein n=1 Tax=Anaeramoeba ignava TaxID=1746090 RepID=A0A9Q0RAZ6_ANAIG|nr:ras-like protein [Anaeramoeba ignava]
MSNDKCRIVIVGSGSVGKSCTAIRYLQGKFVEEYDPTIEESYRKMVIIDQTPTMLEILDTAGQEEYRTVRDKYLKVGDGFLILYSIASMESFLEISQIHQSIRAMKNSSDFPTVTCGNKSDLHNLRQVPKKEGQKIAQKFDSSFFEISAKTGDNVNEAFEDLIRKVRKFKDTYFAKIEETKEQTNVEIPKKKKKKKLCFIL